MRKRYFVIIMIAAMLAALPPVLLYAATPTPAPSATLVPAPLPTPTPTAEPDGGGLFSSIGDLGNWLIHLVIPRDEFFQNEFGKLDVKLKDKLPYQIYIDTIGTLSDVSDATAGSISILDQEVVYAGETVPLEFGTQTEKVLNMGGLSFDWIRGVIRGVFVIALAYYNYRQILFAVRRTTFPSGAVLYQQR
jgi:hypothetical protein